MTKHPRIYPGIALIAAILAAFIAIFFIVHNRAPASLLPEVNLQNFEQNVLQSPTPVFIEFYRQGCHDCDRDTPVLNKLSGEYKGKVAFVRIDMDRNAEIVEALQVTTAPTHVFVDPARKLAVARSGYLDEQALRAFVERGLHPPAAAAPPASDSPAPAAPHATAAPAAPAPASPAAPHAVSPTAAPTAPAPISN